jgi:hypothetical protein
MINPDLKAHHKDQLLAVLFHYMSQELRQKLMLECPAAYNDACGGEFVRVHRVSDGQPVIPGVFPVTRVTFGGEAPAA